jgi:hypothetical protein
MEEPQQIPNLGKQRAKLANGRKASFQTAIPIVVLLTLGGLCGIVIGRFIKQTESAGATTGQMFMTFGLLLLGFYAVMFLQIILHEFGHMVAGWLSGYQFTSFRVGSLMWVKQGGVLRFRRLSIAGTGGQCLMNPPDLQNDRIPVVLYNLGGSLMNLLTVCSAVLLTGTQTLSLFSVLVAMFALIGLGFALINGIPLRLAAVDNDGRNIVTLLQDPKGMKAFWLQMRVNAVLVEGHRQKDLPGEWFAMPEEADLGNSMVATQAVLSIGRMIDSHEFAQAETAIRNVMEKSTALAGVHRLLLNAELIFLELLGEQRTEALSELQTSEMAKFMKAMRSFPSILRVQYGLARLVEKDEKKTAMLRKQIQAVLSQYPYPGEAEAERELLALLDGKATCLSA